MTVNRKIMITTYHGPIKVEGDAFELVAERFIPRISTQNKEIAFVFVGTDFRVDGVAVYDKKNKCFMAPNLKLHFNNLAPDVTINVASVRIDYVVFNSNKNVAQFEGLWIEDETYWELAGKLKKGIEKKDANI
jgi:hypothetical protein